MFRSLSFYWRINLAVIAGAAITTAVLTGALLVGDSVRGSLRNMTLERLGQIDYSITSSGYFREDMTVDLTDSTIFEQRFNSLATAILSRGSAVQPVSKLRATGINVIAIDDQFISFFGDETNASDFNNALARPRNQPLPSIVINESLQKELEVKVGEAILLQTEQPSAIARGSLLGDKSTEDLVHTQRYIVSRIISNRGVGRFGLRPHQILPKNAYISISGFQKSLNQLNKVNTILVSTRNQTSEHELLSQLMDRSLQLRDPGIKIKIIADSTLISLETEAGIFPPHIAQQLLNSVNRLQLQHLPVFTYLANSIRSGERSLPYSTVAAMDVSKAIKSGGLRGELPTDLDADGIILNEWAAQDLKAQPGDSLEIQYYVVGAREELITEQKKFMLRGIARMTLLGADSTLTPEFPGMSEAGNMADWQAPFPVNLNTIRSKDELYWDKYRAAPKAFIAGATGRELWGSRFGNITSIRVAPGPDQPIEETIARIESDLFSNNKATQFGFQVLALKSAGLASSGGATDFSGLFIGFSFFLIVSSVLLVALLFRLGVELRAKEIGLLLATGYRNKAVLRRFLFEGSILATIGSIIGVLGAVAYAWLMMLALRTLWIAAVGSPFLYLYVTVTSIILGLLLSMLTIILTIWLMLRKLSRLPVTALLAGVTSGGAKQRTRVNARWLGYGTLAIAIVLSVSVAITGTNTAGIFFIIGTLLLISGLAFFSDWLRSPHKSILVHKKSTVAMMAIRSTPRSPGRSMLSVALVSSATFVIIAVGAFYRNFGAEALQLNAGTGGYTLVAEADTPLLHDLNSDDGRFELGFSDPQSDSLQNDTIMPFRLRPGDDASCLNLYKVAQPRILGVPQNQIHRGGFSFSQVSEDITNPWQLLNKEISSTVIPAFGDVNSVTYILHSGIGKDIVLYNEFGQEIRVRFVGLLEKSIFQSELLISEENLLKHFPSVSGYGYFLLDSPLDKAGRVSAELEGTLEDYGFDCVTTLDKLRSFQVVENTYLSTFQTLGGFGLLLGTLGLGIILVRNVLERRGEMATMRAFGFRQLFLVGMVLMENGFLLLLGVTIGTISACIAILPHATQLPWLSLLFTISAIFFIGMLSSVTAVRNVLKLPLIETLKAEY